MDEIDIKRFEALYEAETNKIEERKQQTLDHEAAKNAENARLAKEEITRNNLMGHQKSYYQILKKYGQPIPESILNTWPELK